MPIVFDDDPEYIARNKQYVVKRAKPLYRNVGVSGRYLMRLAEETASQYGEDRLLQSSGLRSIVDKVCGVGSVTSDWYKRMPPSSRLVFTLFCAVAYIAVHCGADGERELGKLIL